MQGANPCPKHLGDKPITMYIVALVVEVVRHIPHDNAGNILEGESMRLYLCQTTKCDERFKSFPEL